jgi:hypothetical protein
MELWTVWIGHQPGLPIRIAIGTSAASTNIAVDDTLLVGRIVDSSGQHSATIVNYACHPTTLAVENDLISPDYLGALRGDG